MATSRLKLLAFAFSGSAVLVLAGWWLTSRVPAPASEPPEERVELRHPASPFSIAAVGDIAVPRGLPSSGADQGFDRVVAILQEASLALTNLEGQVWRSSPPAPDPRWSAGPSRIAHELRRVGFTFVGRANNHGADGGQGAIDATTAALDAAGLVHAGSGIDLDAARAPVFLGAAPRRVAFIAITTSASDEAAATKSRGEIKGRAGVNVLRYAPDVTADPATYAALRQMAIASHQLDANSTELRLSGRLIKPGPKTSVEFVANDRDLDDLLNAIASARASADIVIVSLHSHEPGNRSDAPAEFVRRFARLAIDRGANLVVGHGPRRLRGIEIYKGGAIAYSLGNFAFDLAAIDARAADIYDSDTDLAQLAVTAPAGTSSFAPSEYTEPIWWESVVLSAMFDEAKLVRLRLDPIDLGAERLKGERGIPRPAGVRGAAILGTLAALSPEAPMRIQNGAGFIDVAPAPGGVK